MGVFVKSYQKRKASKVTLKQHRKHKEAARETRNAVSKEIKSAESSVVSFHQG